MRDSKSQSSDKSKSSSGKDERVKRIYRAAPIGQVLRFGGSDATTLNQKLNDELIRAYNKVKLTEQEMENRRGIFNKIKEAIEYTFSCTVELHGSFVTGTMVYGSDVDIVVLMSKDKHEDSTNKAHCNNILGKVANIIESSEIVKVPTLHIKNARVPVLKCVDKKYGCHIDIVVDQYGSIERAEFVNRQLKDRPYLRYLVILLKYFLKRRNLSEVVRGGLSSYGQFLMLLSFVQLHPLVQNGNIKVEDNLGTILMDFFQLYGLEFPFENATISVMERRYMPNRDAQINIDDPCLPGHNVAAGCSGLAMIREIFAFSYKIMASAFAENVNTKKAIGELWLRIDDREMVLRTKESSAQD